MRAAWNQHGWKIALASIAAIAAGIGLWEWRSSLPVWVNSITAGRTLLWSGKSAQHFMAVFDEGDEVFTVFVKHQHRDHRASRFTFHDESGKEVDDKQRKIQNHDDGEAAERFSGYSVPVRRGYVGSIRILFEEQPLLRSSGRNESYKKGSGVIDQSRPMDRHFDVLVPWPVPDHLRKSDRDRVRRDTVDEY